MCSRISIDRGALLAAGFVPTTYKGQESEGEFLVRRVLVGSMPEAGQRLVDGDLIDADMIAVTEVTPNAEIQLYIPDADYLDDRQPLDSELGRAMVADAIAGKPAIESGHLSE